MGTIDPPPIAASPTDDGRPFSWRGPLVLLSAVALVGWGGYRLGHQEPTSAPAPTIKPLVITEPAPRVIYVQSPSQPSVPASAAAPIALAPPVPPPARTEERRGYSVTVEAKRDPSLELAAALEATQADEMRWRDRAAAARARLEKAQADYDKADAANSVVVLGGVNRMNEGGYSAALAARNAVLTPYRIEVDAAKADLDRFPEDCRKAGCQPGWIR